MASTSVRPIEPARYTEQQKGRGPARFAARALDVVLARRAIVAVVGDGGGIFFGAGHETENFPCKPARRAMPVRHNYSGAHAFRFARPFSVQNLGNHTSLVD
jgi:hypothetical protein